MFINRQKDYLPLSILLMFLLLTSCFDEKFETNVKEGYVAITGINTRSYEGSKSGDGIDDRVETLRVLAFDKSTNQCKSNVFYYGAALTGSILQHPIKQGEYNFIFLCNEPLHQDIKVLLDGINHYDDVKAIAYPAEFFNSDDFIPMIAENGNVKVLSGGKIEINGVVKTELIVKLRRLAARIDVVLKSKIDLGDINSAVFEGITFSNLPDRVPLVHGLPSNPISGFWKYDDPILTYNGMAITRNVIRKFTLKDDTDYFEINPNILTPTDKANDLVWAARIKRVIVPSSYFTTKTTEVNAIDFTVNIIKDYSPSCKLKILSDPDYRLPANARLDLTAVMREPLEVNIKPSPWISDDNDWEIVGNRILNVSHKEIEMTDLNGVRISFWSNMPVVRVLDTVQKEGEANERPTNEVFNCLAIDGVNNPNPYRFYFDPLTGGGYMDLLIDGTSTVVGAPHIRTENMAGTYTLTLSAEEEDGKNVLQRKIKVVVTQEGLRFVHDPTKNGQGLFNGVFFKHNQTGERIITGQHGVDWGWSVEVPAEFRDWLVVSATPSFDPGVGTESPGDAENYPVTLNEYKGETGYNITGLKGRIYFRIGVKENANFVADKDATPKFGYVNLKYQLSATWSPTMVIHVRQGEAPHYIYGPNDPIPGEVYNGWNGGTSITSEVREDMRLLASDSRNLGAAEFSPLNLTTEGLAGNGNPDYDNVGIRGARFVDFPSQAGAFFQWAVDLDAANDYSSYYRRAYNPTKSLNTTSFPWSYEEFPIMWDGVTGISAYKNQFEVCPPGYRRPTDGYTNKITTNGYYPYLPAVGSSDTDFEDHKADIKYSELRTSLFLVPFAGNASSNADYITTYNNVVATNTGPGTYPYGKSGVARKQLKNTSFTFYSDGFFDRRPVKEASSGNYGVSLGNSKVAYQGVLYFNFDASKKIYRSVFFPATGRLNNRNGNLESAGSTGYYWSSSVGPGYNRSELISGTNDRRMRYGAWALESSFNAHNLRLSYQGFAQAIRCVRE
ncbi:MAG: hypothetical protein ACLS4S_08590 [Bacteroides nordii]